MSEWTFVSTKSAWLDPELSIEAKGLWHVLMGFRNHETGRCFPCIETLAKTLGICRRRVQIAVKELAAYGAITRKRAKGDRGRFDRWEYTVRPITDRPLFRPTVKPSDGNLATNSNPVPNSNPNEEQGSPTDERPSAEEMLEEALNAGTALRDDLLEQAIDEFRESLAGAWAPGLEPSWQVRLLRYLETWMPGSRKRERKPSGW